MRDSYVLVFFWLLHKLTMKKTVHDLVWLEQQTIISLAFLDVAAVV